MLRFITHNFSGIDGISIYPILSLLIFVIFFAFVIIYVIRMEKSDVKTLSSLPFEDTKIETQDNE